MARLRLEPFKIIGSTPAIKKTYGNAVALAPVAPLVAEVGQVDDRYILRISNYETAKTVGQVASPSFHPTLSFAPDGERLLVMTGWRGRGEDLLLYREPWESPRIINQDPPHYAALDGAWLDERTILIAGLLDDHEFCIAVLEVESGASRIVYRKIPEPADDSYPVSFDSASCSPTGSVVFVINYGYGHGQRILLYQLNERYDAVLPITSILLNRDTFYGSYDSGIIIAEDGQTMLSKPSSYSSWHASTRLFNRQGHLLTELYKNQELLAYRYGTACFRRDAGYGTHEIHIYYLREGKLLSRCTLYVRGCYGCNLSERNGKILIAVEEEEKTTVFELTDPDILRLASEDAQQRCGAMQVLGRRHLRDAIPVLAQVLLKDEDASVRLTAVEALVEIGDPAAIPRLIFALGHKACDHLRGELIAALQQFSIAELVPVAFEYIDRVGNAHSRGAARLLEAMPFIEALDKLCKAIGDPDEETRLSAAHALRKRADVRACIALLERMNDEDERVRTAVQHALNRILRVRGLLSREISQHLTIPMDAAVYAEKVIAKGRMRGFERIGPSPIGRFLVSLSAACVQSGQALPQLLNAIEALADGGQSAERTSLSIALVVALICADTMRKEQNWKGAVGTYRVAVELARRIDAPQIEWRAWHAAGECLEKLGDDPTALAAFRHAMDILDRLWFALLEEDKLRGFFRDKALLYDRAALCALRLGHAALALECGEKAKTRYLGDLIARRQMDPRVSLDRELKEIWQNIGHARSIRVQIGSSQPAGKDRVEVVATRWEVRKVGDKAVKLERLSAFEEAHPDDKETSRQHAMIRGVWQLMAYLPNVDDEEIHEYVEEIYQALLPVRQAAKSSELPMPSSEQQIVIERYNNAARALSRAGENIQEAPFWIFSENNFGWIEEICNSTDEEEAGLFLDAVMEALNSYLRDEPIIGVPTEPFDEEAEGPVFVTRTLGGGSASPSRGTTTIETLLESRTHTRWRYITRLARGEIVAYQDVSEALRGQTGVAQVQFAVTAQGTVAYVTHSCEDSRRRSRTMPDLRGDASLCVFTCPEIKLSSLRQRLALADNAWFARYKQRHQAGGLQSWMSTLTSSVEA